MVRYTRLRPAFAKAMARQARLRRALPAYAQGGYGGQAPRAALCVLTPLALSDF